MHLCYLYNVLSLLVNARVGLVGDCDVSLYTSSDGSLVDIGLAEMGVVHFISHLPDKRSLFLSFPLTR